jgi:hypothetical protein
MVQSWRDTHGLAGMIGVTAGKEETGSGPH